MSAGYGAIAPNDREESNRRAAEPESQFSRNAENAAVPTRTLRGDRRGDCSSRPSFDNSMSERAGDRARTGDVQLGKLAFYH